MAAPVRVEAVAMSDPRIDLWAQLMGVTRDDAMGKLVRIWSWATDRGSDEVATLLLDSMLGVSNGVATLVQSDLAERISDTHVRLRGGKRLLWLNKKRETARANGRKGASKQSKTKRKKKQARGKQKGSNEEAIGKQNPSNVYSKSYSNNPSKSSNKSSKSTTELTARARDIPLDFMQASQVAAQIVEHLAEQTGRERKTSGAGAGANLGPVQELLDEHAPSVGEIKLVCDYLVASWGHKPSMREHLHPRVMFRLDRWHERLESAQNWEAEGRPSFRRSARGTGNPLAAGYELAARLEAEGQ